MTEVVSPTIASAEPVQLELSEEDRKRFQERDEDFVYQTWDDIKDIIGMSVASIKETKNKIVVFSS